MDTTDMTPDQKRAVRAERKEVAKRRKARKRVKAHRDPNPVSSVVVTTAAVGQICSYKRCGKKADKQLAWLHVHAGKARVASRVRCAEHAGQFMRRHLVNR